MAEPTNHPEGFADRIAREARDEAQSVMGELARLRFRADQVARVLRALKLPYPEGLQLLLSGGRLDGEDEEDIGPLPIKFPEAATAAPPETETEAPPSPPGPPKRPAPPEAPEAEPEPAADASPAEPVASAQTAPSAPEDGAVATSPSPRTGRTYVTSTGVTRTTPVNPGPEAVPEHLRSMPAASGNGPVGSRISAAEGQLKVYNDIQANPGSLPPEIADRVGFPQGRTGHYVRQLAEARLIERTGTQRFKHGVKTGRVGDEWRVAERLTNAAPEAAAPANPQSAAEAEARPAAPTGAAPAAPSVSSTSDVLTAGRDWIVKRGGQPFTPVTFAEALGILQTSAMQLLQLFADRGIVKDLSAPGSLLYAYDPPTSPGRAAELDRERAKGRTAAERDASRNGNGTAVAGTGRSRFSNHPGTQAICEKAAKAGALVEKSGGDHIIIRHAVTRARVVLASTPSGEGSPDKTKKRLAAIGINI